jgi:hypothetical protein
MARIRSRLSPSERAAGDDLVDPIVKALSGESQSDEPVIFEVPMGETDYLQVIVVWERWADLSADVRSRIVTEAYQRLGAEHPDEVTVDRLSMILAVTPSQAIDLGLLPYSVHPTNVHPSEPRYSNDILPLLRREGAIDTDSGPELRLPTQAMAREARDRLREATLGFEPDVRWQIGEQVGRIFDY